MARHEVETIIGRLQDGEEAFRRARTLIQRDRWSDAETALRRSVTQSIGALEWALKAHLRDPQRRDRMAPEDISSLRQPTFDVLIRLVGNYGDINLSKEDVSALFAYRELRNQSEHGAAIPSPTAIQEATSAVRRYVSLLLNTDIAPKSTQPAGRGYVAPQNLPPRPVALPGRDAELHRLASTLERVKQSGRGHLLLVGGVSGAGKTHLCREILHTAVEAGFDVLSTACEPFQGGTTLFPIRELIRQLTGHMNASAAHDVLYPSQKVGAQLAELAEDSSADPAARRDAYFATFANLIYGRFSVQMATSIRPLLLFLDDLEWAESSTIDALLCLKSRFGEGPVLVMGAYRTDIVAARGAQHPLCPLINIHNRQPETATLLNLDGLPRSILKTVIETILGGSIDISHSAIERFYQECEGNPLFLREILHGLVNTRDDDAALTADSNGIWRMTKPVSSWAIPASIEEAIESRLQHLTSDQREELERAAVVGRNFAYSLLLELSGRDQGELDDDIEAFLKFDVIREGLSNNDAVFEFTHGKIRDVVYEHIPRFRQARMHRDVAITLQRLSVALASEINAGMIGRHFYLGGNLTEARIYLVTGANEALGSLLTSQACELYRLALDACTKVGFPKDFEETDLRLAYANALKLAGSFRNAIAVLEDGRAAFEYTSNDGAVANALGDLHWLIGDSEVALDHYLRCENIAKARGDTELLLDVAADLFELHDREAERYAGVDDRRSEAHRQKSHSYLDQQLALAATSKTSRSLARAMRNKAKQRRRLGDLPGALDAYEEALSHTDSRHADHSILISYAKTLRFMGRHAEANEVVARVLNWGCQTGSPRTEAIARQYLGLMMMESNDPLQYVSAETEIRRALFLHEEIHYGRGIRETRLLLGEWHLRAGRIPAAIEEFRIAINSDSRDRISMLRAAAAQLEGMGELHRSAEVLRYCDE